MDFKAEEGGMLYVFRPATTKKAANLPRYDAVNGILEQIDETWRNAAPSEMGFRQGVKAQEYLVYCKILQRSMKPISPVLHALRFVDLL